MMNRLLSVLSLAAYASGCTNFFASKGATTDGSTILAYNAGEPFLSWMKRQRAELETRNASLSPFLHA
jgi:hypothetical protein